MKNIIDILNKFGKRVVAQSRANLTRQKRNVTKELYDSLAYEIKEDNGQFSVAFIMAEYGQFIDEGVNGKEKSYGAPNSFKSKMPPIKDMAEWAKKRGIRLRDEKGKFKKGNYKTIGFLIARSVFKKGIKPSLFFTKPFEKAFEDFEEDILEQFLEDIEDLDEGE